LCEHNADVYMYISGWLHNYKKNGPVYYCKINNINSGPFVNQ